VSVFMLAWGSYSKTQVKVVLTRVAEAGHLGLASPNCFVSCLEQYLEDWRRQ
jgi:hypothetical protein